MGVIEKLLLLSHGQASVVRGFSVNKQIMSDNMGDHTIIAQRTISNPLCSIGGVQNLIMHDKRITAFCVERKKKEGKKKVENERQP